MLKSPDMVQDHLRIFFRDQEHESIVTGDRIAVTGNYLLRLLSSAPSARESGILVQCLLNIRGHDGDQIFRICKNPIDQNPSFCKEQAEQM